MCIKELREKMSGTINDFLRRCLHKVADKVQPLTAVLGNEGGDMDSVVGCIYLAILFDRQPRYGFENAVPALNFPFEDFVLRNDVAKLFKELGVDDTLLMSVQKGRSTCNFVDIAGPRTALFLHDHNKLRNNQNCFSSKVIGIVDHHFDENEHMSSTVKIRKVQPVGSACTLVTQLYRECSEHVPCPQLLKAPIVLDTVNFDPAQKKVTPEDIEAYEWLCSEDGSDPKDNTALFLKLSKWKNDVLSLNIAEILRRDYKHFTFDYKVENRTLSVGTSSVPCSCPELESHFSTEKLITAIANYIEEKCLDILILAFAGKVNDVHSREIAFCAKKDMMCIFGPFTADTHDSVRFSKITESCTNDGIYYYASYSLSDSSISRKKLVPALSRFLSEGVRSFL